jgi:hypothetical protein
MRAIREGRLAATTERVKLVTLGCQPIVDERVIAKSLSDRNESIEEGLPSRGANERLRKPKPARLNPCILCCKRLLRLLSQWRQVRATKAYRTIFDVWCGDP